MVFAPKLYLHPGKGRRTPRKDPVVFSRRCSLSAYAFGDGEGRSSQRWNDNDTGTYALAAIVLIAEMAHCRPDSRELM